MAHAECEHGVDLTLYACSDCREPAPETVQHSIPTEAARANRSETSNEAPFLQDRATGVQGIYCIARVVNGTTEYWTGAHWAAFCNDMYFDLRPALKADVDDICGTGNLHGGKVLLACGCIDICTNQRDHEPRAQNGNPHA